MSRFESKIIRREIISENALLFYVAKPEGFDFKSGQNVDIEIINPPETDKDGNKRTMSILSSPLEDELKFVTRLRDSAWKRNIKNATSTIEVILDGPYGNMTLHSDVTKPAIFLAGGIGIAPFMSMLRYVSQTELSHKIFLFYSNKNKNDAPFFKELMEMENINNNFKFIPTMTQDAEWKGEKRRINFEIIKKYVDPSMAYFYLAGQPQMVDSLIKSLETNSVLSDYIKREDFAGY